MGENVIASLHELVRFRDLLWNLVKRDLKVRYKNSVLGILWSWLNPLFMMTVYTVVFTVMRASSNGVSNRQFPVFVLCALLPWNFFSGSVMGSISTIVDNSSLVKKVYFPREILPLSVVVSNLVNFGISLMVLFPMMLLFQVRITWWVLMLPVLILIQTCFVSSVCLLLSTLHVYYRDARAIMDVVMMAWMFVTPVFYPIDILPRSRDILGVTINIHRWTRILNPMASLVAAYRDILFYGRPIGLDFLARTVLTSLLALTIGYAVFHRFSKSFGELV